MDKLLGHGGLFKTKGVGQQILADAMNTPISVMETAGEGGAWGIAVLASYMIQKEEGETLGAYLNDKVFAGQEGASLEPDPEGVIGLSKYIRQDFPSSVQQLIPWRCNAYEGKTDQISKGAESYL